MKKKAFFVAATGQHIGKTTTCLGLVSGLLGALGAEIAVGVLSSTVFDFSFKLHPWIWGFGPLLGMAIIAIFGIISCRSAISSPPLSTLRSFN